MRLYRLNTGRGGFDDLVELIGHLAGCRDYDNAVAAAFQGCDLLDGEVAIAALLAETVPPIPPAGIEQPRAGAAGGGSGRGGDHRTWPRSGDLPGRRGPPRGGDGVEQLRARAGRVGRFDEAIGAYQCHIAICAKLGDQYGQARTLENLGTVHAELDQPKRARRAWTDTIEFYAAAGAEDDADRVRQAIAQLGGGPAADDLVIERAIGAGDALTSS